MRNKVLLAMITAAFILSFTACGEPSKQYNTDSLKKYVEKSKQKNNWTPEEREKALKSIFPKMKLN